MSEPGVILWFTGLSGAGKSTLAGRLAPLMRDSGQRVEVLDGDEVRANLSKGLGFSQEDRDTNVRRIGYVARLLARNGVTVITAAISPYAAIRDEVRASVRDEGVEFVEIHVDCALDELIRRDVKGLYLKALRGEIENFTGVSDPYQTPCAPEIHVDSGVQSEQESLAMIVEYLESRRLLPVSTFA